MFIPQDFRFHGRKQNFDLLISRGAIKVNRKTKKEKRMKEWVVTMKGPSKERYKKEKVEKQRQKYKKEQIKKY